MSALKNETKQTKSPVANDGSGARSMPQFIRYRLTEAELAQARNACLEMADLGEIVEQFVAENYKFSASYDSYGGGIQVFLTPTPKQPSNQGLTLTARAPDLRLAVGMLAFKHYTLFGQEWPREAPERKGESWG